MTDGKWCIQSPRSEAAVYLLPPELVDDHDVQREVPTADLLVVGKRHRAEMLARIAVVLRLSHEAVVADPDSHLREADVVTDSQEIEEPAAVDAQRGPLRADNPIVPRQIRSGEVRIARIQVLEFVLRAREGEAA